MKDFQHSVFFYVGVIGHRYRVCPNGSTEEMDVKQMNYGPWMGGVDHMASEQICSLDMKLQTTKESSTDMGLLTDNGSMEVSDPDPVPSRMAAGTSENLTAPPVGFTTPKKKRHQ